MDGELKRLCITVFSALGFFAALCFLMIFLVSCSAINATNLDTAKELSPDQIKALNESNLQIVSCFMVGGPPVGGKITKMVVPKDRQVSIEFTPDCQIKSATVGALIGGQANGTLK